MILLFAVNFVNRKGCIVSNIHQNQVLLAEPGGAPHLALRPEDAATALAISPRLSEPLSDRQAIIRTMRLFHELGQVTEVRALDAVTDDDQRPHTESGFFDNPEALADAVAGIRAARGIYFTPNPVDAALLERASNRIRKAVRGDGTQDIDILRRRWFLIDIDPKRQAGVSSTQAEFNAAMKLRNEVNRYLSERGWPKPVTAISGNGIHLLYRVDLPADDHGLVQHCLEALGRWFDNDRVLVDRTVYNPARIVRLYGTRACKGNPTEDRPHRMSLILGVPKELQVVPRKALEDLATEAGDGKAERKGKDGKTTNGKPFDIEGFIREHSLDATGPEPWNCKEGAGHRWVLKTSPMCEHHDGAAFIVQLGNGAVQAGCHHNSCSWDWQALRAHLEAERQKLTVSQPNSQLGTVVRPSTASLPKVHLPGGRVRVTDTARVG